MQLNHLNLQVSDAAQCADFLTRYFSAHIVLEKPDRSLIALRAGDFDLVLQQSEGGAAAAYPAGFHFGFIRPTSDSVHALHRGLLDAGVPGVGPVERSRRGEQFFVQGPCGLTIEVGCHQPLR